MEEPGISKKCGSEGRRGEAWNQGAPIQVWESGSICVRPRLRESRQTPVPSPWRSKSGHPV